MNTRIRHEYVLGMLVLVSVLSTFMHNVDNYVHFEHYPQPDWITPFGIIRSWIIWTTFGMAGYLLYRNRRFWPSYFCLIIYSTCGLSSLVHYLYGSLDDFSMFMHSLILADGVAGLAVLGFTLWSGLFLKAHIGKPTPVAD